MKGGYNKMVEEGVIFETKKEFDPIQCGNNEFNFRLVDLKKDDVVKPFFVIEKNHKFVKDSRKQIFMDIEILKHVVEQIRKAI